MAMVEVILHGFPVGESYDTHEEPVILRFEEGNADYEQAFWHVPSFPEDIPTWALSELRVQAAAKINVMILGPDGETTGPYVTTWIRSTYPSDKLVSLLAVDASTRSMSGVTITVEDEKLILGELMLGGPKTS